MNIIKHPFLKVKKRLDFEQYLSCWEASEQMEKQSFLTNGNKRAFRLNICAEFRRYRNSTFPQDPEEKLNYRMCFYNLNLSRYQVKTLSRSPARYSTVLLCFELGFIKLPVQSAVRKQFSMATGIYNFTVLYNKNLVGIQDGG